MHPTLCAISAAVALLSVPVQVLAQTDAPALDATTSRPFRETPEWVERLEQLDIAPPCGEPRSWARSVLDGSLVSRTRPASLPCRDVWEHPIRLELGVAAGGLIERGDGALGGLSLSLGLRYGQYFSVYYQLTLLGGGWASGGGLVGDAIAWNAVLLELSPHERISIAIGPSIDIVGSCSAGVAQDPSSCDYAWSYGLATRVTVPLAQLDSVGIGLTADFHLSVLENESRDALGVSDGTRAVVLGGVAFRL